MLPTTSSELHSASLPLTAATTNATSSESELSFPISHNVLEDHVNAVKNKDNSIIVALDKYERTDNAPISMNEGIIDEANISNGKVEELFYQTPINLSPNERDGSSKTCNGQDENVESEWTDRRKTLKNNSQTNKNNHKTVSINKSKENHNSERSLMSTSSCDMSLLSPALRLLHEVTYERIAHIATASFSAKHTNEFTLTEHAYPALSRMFNLLVLLGKRTMRAIKLAAERAKEDERCAMLYEHAAQWKEKKKKMNAALLEKEVAAEMKECTFTPSITQVARRRCSNKSNYCNGDINNSKFLKENKEKTMSARAQQAFMEKCLQWQHAVQARLKQRQVEEEKEEAERIAKERATRLRRIRAWTSHKEHNTPLLSWAQDMFGENENDIVIDNNSNKEKDNRSLFLPTAATTKTRTSLQELTDQSANLSNYKVVSENEEDKTEKMENLLQKQEEESEEEWQCNLYHEEDCHVPITSRSERSAREYVHQLSRSANKATSKSMERNSIPHLSPRSQTKDMSISTTKARKVQMPTHLGGNNLTANHSHEPRRTLRQFLNDVANDKSKREMHVKELQEHQNEEQNVVHLSDNMLSPLFVPNALPSFRTEDGRVVEYDHLDTFEKERARALLRQHHLEYLITRHELEQAKRIQAKGDTRKEQEHNTLNKSNSDNVGTNGKSGSTITENYKLSKSRTLQLVERLEAHQIAKEARLQALQEHIQQKECSFQPKITHKSQLLARRKNGNVPIYKRANMQAWNRYPFLHEEEHYHDTKEENNEWKEHFDLFSTSISSDYNGDVTKRSNDNNDSSRCNINLKNKESNYHILHNNGKSQKHDTEENFKKTENETQNDIHTSHQVTEKINDMLTRSSMWNERRLQRIRLARAEQEAAQLVECTFKPQRLQIHSGTRVNRTHYLSDKQNDNINNNAHEQELEYEHNKENKHFSSNDDDVVNNNYRISPYWTHQSALLQPSEQRQGNNHRHYNYKKNVKSKNVTSSRSSYIDEIEHVSPELSYNSTELHFTPFDDLPNNRFNRKEHKNEIQHQRLFKSPIKQVERRQDALATAANIRVMQELEMLRNELIYHKDCVMRQMSNERNKSNQLNSSHDYKNVPHDTNTTSQNHEHDELIGNEKTQQHDDSYANVDIDIDDIKEDDDTMKYRIDNYINDSNNNDSNEYRNHNKTIDRYHDAGNEYDNDVDDDIGVLNDEEDMWDELDEETDAIISMLEQKNRYEHLHHVEMEK